MKIDTLDRIEGILIGTAVGDCLGLPMECMKPATIEGLGWARDWKHRFILRKGMWSDDTEHTIMLTQALLVSAGDVSKFSNKFAWELRWWLFGFPSGVGMATTRAVIKLCLGFSAEKSGVFSAGNGACMRTAILAAYFLDEPEKRRQFTIAQTRITHIDPKASVASVAITELAALFLHSSTPPSHTAVLEILKSSDRGQSCSDWSSICSAIEEGLANPLSLSEFLPTIGIDIKKGISGYAYHTAPVVIYSGCLHQWDFESVVTEIITAGGDTDSTAAIAGALCGSLHGAKNIPHSWVSGILEWPTGVNELKVLARAVNDKTPLRVRPDWSPLLLLRNILFFIIVLRHGFTRLLPDCVRRKFS
jgi:ADP-ribosylglycohydrolase